MLSLILENQSNNSTTPIDACQDGDHAFEYAHQDGHIAFVCKGCGLSFEMPS